jgi:uncharacterized protein with PQ loop repeat
MNMAVVAIVFGILLDVAGIVSYVSTGSVHKTALIPCVFGVLIFLCGAMALNPKFLKHAMHVAAMVGLLGFVAALIPNVMKLVKGKEISTVALASTGSMAILCGIFVGLCVKSFIDIRRARRAAQG